MLSPASSAAQGLRSPSAPSLRYSPGRLGVEGAQLARTLEYSLNLTELALGTSRKGLAKLAASRAPSAAECRAAELALGQACVAQEGVRAAAGGMIALATRLGDEGSSARARVDYLAGEEAHLKELLAAAYASRS
jgi:hypothetical protein